MAETFLQRQQRLNTAGTTTKTAGTTTGSPVSSTGYPQAPTAPKPAGDSLPNQTAGPQPAQQLQGGGTDPFAASGGGVWNGSGWVPKNHPQAQQYQQQQPTAAGSVQPNPAQYSPYGHYPGRPANTQLQGTNLGNDPFMTYQGAQVDANFQAGPGYQGTQFQQFQSPQHQQMNAAQMELMSQVLQNPHSMSAQNVAQLKESQKEQALLMAQQLQQRAGSAAAARGFQGDGSTMGAAQRGIDQDMLAQIIGSNRGIDIAKMQQDRQDELQALQASEALLSGQTGRSSELFRTGLLGQQTQAGDDQARAQSQLQHGLSEFDARMQGNQFNADEAFRQFSTQRDSQDANLQRALSQFGINQAVNESNQSNYGMDLDAFFKNRGLDVQQQLGQGGLNIDSQRLGENRRQFNLAHALDRARFGEDGRQFNNDLGYKYNVLDSNNQNNMFDRLIPR